MKNKNGFCVTALVLGIIAIATSFVPIINNLSFILGLIGLVFAIIALKQKAPKGKTVTGLVLCVLSMVITLAVQSSISKQFDEINDNISYSTGEKTD